MDFEFPIHPPYVRVFQISFLLTHGYIHEEIIFRRFCILVRNQERLILTHFNSQLELEILELINNFKPLI